MYETSSTLRRPTRSLQSLWRYLAGDRLCDLLATQELFFTHLPVLEDQFEGSLTRRSAEHVANWFQSQNRSTRASAYDEVATYQKQRENFFVNCWHMNNHESYLMWKAYGDRGYAIQTTFERLQASFETLTPAITGGVVDYVDFNRDTTAVGNVFNHVATKDMPYCDEREFRLVFWALDPRNSDYCRQQSGVRIPVNVRLLVEAVVRSPYAAPLEPRLEELLERHGIPLTTSAISVKP